MIWCRYSVGGDVSFGLIEGETVRKVEGMPWGVHKVAAQSSPLASVKLELPPAMLATPQLAVMPKIAASTSPAARRVRRGRRKSDDTWSLSCELPLCVAPP